MLDLLNSCENVIITKFFDKIWKRYLSISNLGEGLIDLGSYMQCFPEKKDQIQSLIGNRSDGEEEIDMPMSEAKKETEDKDSEDNKSEDKDAKKEASDKKSAELSESKK
jgi:hypothetical protein